MIVIVGAGQAAAQLVLSLRQGGYKEPIRMIGDEPYAPYQRPPLSKKFLAERPPANTLYFRPEKFWGEQGMTADYGMPVESIDRTNKRVQVFDLDGTFLEAWTDLGAPYGLAIASDDTLYTSDADAGTITVSKNGRVLDVIENLGRPHEITLDPSGAIYMGDVRAYRARKIYKAGAAN